MYTGQVITVPRAKKETKWKLGKASYVQRLMKLTISYQKQSPDNEFHRVSTACMHISRLAAYPH